MNVMKLIKPLSKLNAVQGETTPSSGHLVQHHPPMGALVQLVSNSPSFDYSLSLQKYYFCLRFLKTNLTGQIYPKGFPRLPDCRSWTPPSSRRSALRS